MRRFFYLIVNSVPFLFASFALCEEAVAAASAANIDEPALEMKNSEIHVIDQIEIIPADELSHVNRSPAVLPGVIVDEETSQAAAAADLEGNN